MQQLEELIGADYLPLSEETGRKHALKNGEVIRVLPDFLTREGILLMRAEAHRLLGVHGKRKDRMLNGTPRNLTTVNGTNLLYGKLITGLLQDPRLLEFVQGITGKRRLVPYRDQHEASVLVELSRKGDTHGAHVDEFPYVINFAIEAPGAGGGGVLQFVPGNRDIHAIEGPDLQEVTLRPGDGYVMRDVHEIAHRVSALTRDERRIIASLALTDPQEPHRPSRSSGVMFDNPA